ncbi:MAG: hypothetical protein AAFQ40_00190 [Cyanobacteria bacterium J06623_5]
MNTQLSFEQNLGSFWLRQSVHTMAAPRREAIQNPRDIGIEYREAIVEKDDAYGWPKVSVPYATNGNRSSQ